MSRLSFNRLEGEGVLSMLQSAPAAVLPVDVAGLDRIEDSLYALETGIGALKEVLRSPISEDHMQFITSTLIAALSQSLTGCFEAMSDGALMRSERHLLKA
jgi:hypothetical protein